MRCLARFSHPQTLDYLAAGWEGVPAAGVPNPFPHDVNGSLWTLPIELRLYVGVLLAGLAGLLSRRLAWLVALLALVATFAVRPTGFPLRPDDRVVRELALLFGLGSLAWVWRDALPVSLAGAAGAVLLVVLDPAGCRATRSSRRSCLRGAGARVPPAAAVARVQPRRRLFVRAVRLLVPAAADPDAAAAGLEPLGLFALALPLALLVAAASWHGLEAPALA